MKDQLSRIQGEMVYRYATARFGSIGASCILEMDRFYRHVLILDELDEVKRVQNRLTYYVSFCPRSRNLAWIFAAKRLLDTSHSCGSTSTKTISA